MQAVLCILLAVVTVGNTQFFIDCPPNCQETTCTHSGCVQCNPGFCVVLNGGICLLKCPKGYGCDRGSTTLDFCSQCHNHCEECSLSIFGTRRHTTCTKCESGYDLKDDRSGCH